MHINRPLSPHITVHKWILSQIMSILHRVTAIGCSIGLLFIALWMMALSLGPQFMLLFQLIFYNYFGKIILLILSFCFSFHFIDEFRRIFWAFGFGLDIKTIKVTSYMVVFFSILITTLVLVLFL